MKRKAWGLRVERLLGRRGTLRRRLAGIGGGIAVAATGVFGFAVLAGIVSFEIPACEAATPTPPDFQTAPFAFDPEARASAFVQAMADDDFQAAYSMLAYFPESGASLCDYVLEDLWDVVRSDHSSIYWEAVVIRPAAIEAFDPIEDVIHVQYHVNFEDGSRTEVGGSIAVLVWRDGRVSPIYDWDWDEERSTSTYPVPPYANHWAFEEFDVTIAGPGGDLDATVAMPRGPALYPAVVLVPGMWNPRYADRDATTPRIKPLRDLAWGLASLGVATLRYDNRTWTHAASSARQLDFTLTDEYVDDALAAVDLLRGLPRINPARIHVLAFERAGLAGPHIAQRDPDLAGLILFSAPSGTLWDSYLSIVEREIRTKYQAELQSSDADVRARARTEINRELGVYSAQGTDARTLSAGGAVENLTLRPAYHRDLASYLPAAAARSLQLPILVVHGALHRLGSGTFNEWFENLYQHANATFFFYPDHYDYLLDVSELRGAVTSSQRADALPRHVAPEAVADIADWIRGGRPADVCTGTQTGPNGCRGGPDARVRG